MLSLIGKKCGMMRVFTQDGESVPVTVIEASPNRIVQVKNQNHDGYVAIQVTSGKRQSSRLTKALQGHYAKAQVEAGDGLWEFRVEEKALAELPTGKEISADIFKAGDIVDVQGITKGKGFAGVIKRHHFSSQDATHGNSLSHRAPGSIGQRQTPGRVFKGKRMAGHLGCVKRTIQSQQIVKIDLERNLLLVRGGIPGAPGGFVIISPAVKVKKNDKKTSEGK